MSTYFKLVLDKPATEGFIMPKGFESNVEIHAWGAGGGSGGGPRGGAGGGGSYAYAEVQINAGDFVEMIIGKPGLSTGSTVGGQGGQGSFLSLNFSGGSGGDGYDGDGDNDGGWAGGGGGSASAVLVNDRRVCVAAGGGGGGGTGDDYATGVAGQAGDDYPAAKSTIWFKVKDKAWSTFMNTYAVWSHPREGTKTYKTDIYFPFTGTYTFQYASDNISSFKIDNGSAVGSLGNTSDSFKNDHSLTESLSFGYHTIEATIQNTGGPGGWAFRILNPDGSELWNSTLAQTESGLTRNTNGGDGIDGVGGGGGGGGGAYGGRGGTGVGNHHGGGRAGNGGQSYGDIIGSGNLTQAGGQNTEYYPGPNYANANRPGYIVMLFKEKFRAWEKTTPLAANVQILRWYGNAFGNIMTVSSSANVYVGMRTNVANVGTATVTSVWTGNSNVQLSSGNIGTISGNASFYFAPGIGSDWKNLEQAWVKVRQDEDIIQTITYTQNSTFVVPPKVSKLDVELIGGGGAGGYSNRKSSNFTGQQGGGGGGSGAYIKTSLTAAQGVIKGAVFPVVVGQGGANITLLSNSTEFRSSAGAFLQVGDDPGLDLEAGNWCIEAWVYPLSYAVGPAINCIVSKRANKTDKSPYTIGLLNGKLKTFISQSAFSWDLGLNTGDTVTGGITSSRVVDLNRWTHIAVVRVGNTIKQYIDGVLDGSGTLRFSNTALLSNFADLTIGASSLYDDIGVDGLGYTFDGLITNFRITKGVSVYVNNFIPSKIPLSFSQVAGTNINAISAAQVSLLTCQSGNDHVDGSQYGLVITPNGGPTFSELNPFDIEGLRDGGVSKFGTLIANGGRAGAHADYNKNTAGIGGAAGTAVVPTGYTGGRNGSAGGNGTAVTNSQITPPGVNAGDASGGKGADSALGTGGASGIGGDGQGGSATGYGAGGGGAGADAPSTFAMIWDLSDAANYTINYNANIASYANTSGLSTPTVSVAEVITFGVTANANITFDAIAGAPYYNRTVTTVNKVNLVNQLGLEYQINKGGGGWGEAPDQSHNDFVYLQYSINGTTWITIDRTTPNQITANKWVTKRIATPSGAKAAGGVYLRFLNSGQAPGVGGPTPPRDTWAVTSLQNYTSIDTRAAYRGGSGSDGLVKVTYTQTVKGDSIWKLINQIYVKESGAWYPLISNATISTSIGTTRTYRSIQPTTWTVPPGVNKLFVSLVGGGGGGGALSGVYSNNPKYAGAEGSPGSVIRGNVDVNPGDIITVGVGGGGGAGTSGQTLFYTAKGTYSYTVPPGITSLWIAAIGAGGGGGGGHFGYYNDDIGSGQDGMSGHYLRGNLDVVPGDIITFEVGQGGRAGSQGRKRAGGLGGVSGNNSRELSGGSGGSSGVIDWSGTGGGGGAATVVKKNGTIVAVAAGGAGGGGGGYEVDTAYWYHIRGVRNWHGFLNDYAIWKRPFIGRHAFHADILFPVTGWYTFNYASDGDLEWRLNGGSYTKVFNGNVANVFTSNSFISSTGVKHLQCKLKNYTETGGWALQILKPNGDELWNTRFGNADVYSLSTPDPNPSMAMTPYVSSGATFGGNGAVSITNGGGGGGGGGGYPFGGAGGDVNDATIRETVFATSNVQLPRSAWNGYFTRTANAQSSISSTTVKEYFIRFEGKNIYSSTKPPTDPRYKAGTYRGSQFGVAAGGVAANPPPAVTLTFTANTTWAVPAGVTSISVTATGAGGGGGGNHLDCGVSNGSGSHGGGKGGGGYVQTSTIVVTPGENLTLIVGQGGAGGLRSNTKNQYYGGTGQTTFVKRGATTLTSAAGGTGGGNGHSGGKGSDGTGGAATNGGTGGIVNSQGVETIGNAGGNGSIVITFTSIITPYGDYLNCYDLKIQEYWGWGGFTGSDGQDYLPAGWETVLDPAIPNEIVFDLDDAANVTLGSGVSLYTYDEVTGRISGIGMEAPGLDGNVAVFGLTGTSPSGEVRTITSSDRIDLSDYEQLYFEVNMGTTSDWGEAPDYNHNEYLQFEYSIDGITWTALDTTWPWWYWNQYDYGYYYNNYYYYQWYYWYYWNYRRNWQNRISPNTWMTKTADLPEAARQIGGVYLRFYEKRIGLTSTPRDTWAVTSVYSVGRRAEGAASNGGRGGYRNNWWGGYWRHYWWWWGWGGWWWWYWYSNSGKDGAVYVVPTAGIGAGQAGGSSIGYSGGKGGSAVVDPRFIETTKYHSVSFNGSTRTHLAIKDEASLNLQGANWAIEAYIYPTRFDEFDTIVAKRNNSTAEYGPFVIGLRKGKLQTYISQSGTGWTIGANAVPNLANTTTALGGTTLSPTLVLNEWTHVAVVRSGTFIKQFVDGVLVSTNTLTSGNANLMTSNANVTIGSSGTDGQNVFNGYISNFRMTKGQSVYEGNFPVPSSPLAEIQNAGPGPNIGAITGSNVSLLTCQSGVFIDNSTYGHAVYPRHNAKIQALDPFVRSYARQFIVKGVYNNIGAGGGGGGGASAILVNGNVYAVASGGGGGAGALGNTEKALRSVAYVDGGNVFGGQGTNRLSSGGAGGGGGGGYNGGQGGALVPGNKGGYAGSDGANLIPPGWFEDEDDDKAKNGGRTGQNGTNGTVTISYFKP